MIEFDPIIVLETKDAKLISLVFAYQNLVMKTSSKLWLKWPKQFLILFRINDLKIWEWQTLWLINQYKLKITFSEWKS